MSGPVGIARLELSEDHLAGWLEAVADAGESPPEEASDGPPPVLFLEGPVDVVLDVLTERPPAGGVLPTASVVRVFTPAWELYGRRRSATAAGLEEEMAGPPDSADGQEEARPWSIRAVGPVDDLERLGRLVPGPDLERTEGHDVWIEREPLDGGSAPEGRRAGERQETVLLAGRYAPNADGWWEGTYGRSLRYPVEAVDAPDELRGETPNSSQPPRMLDLEVERCTHRGATFWRWRRIVPRFPEGEENTGEGR